jgi:hypothetical protein
MCNTEDNLQYETPQGAKTENLMVRLTEEDKALMVELSKKYRLSLSALLRLMLSILSQKDIHLK